MFAKKPARGFTLIELSIVLVIIGLVVGGVLVGQDLIKAAQMRRIVRDVERLQTVIETFRLKYNGLPGDLSTAGNFWPLKNTGDPYACWVAAGGSMTETCNGNGDGSINRGIYLSGPESAFLFNHLSLAGLLPGQLGNFDGGQGWSIWPNNDFGPGHYAVANLYDSGVDNGWYFNGILPGNNIFLFSNSPLDNLSDSITPGLLLYGEALQFDTKLDDGNLLTGNIRSEWSAVADTCKPADPSSHCILGFVTKM